MKPYYVDGPFDPDERPFVCEFPPELDKLLHGTTYCGFCLYASSSPSKYTMDARVDYSRTHEGVAGLRIDEYLDEFASTGRRPAWIPFGVPEEFRDPDDPCSVAVVPLFDGPVTLQDGYHCYHVTSETVLPDGQAFSIFRAKAILGDGRVDFTFHAPDRAEVWKECWLAILMSFRLCEGIEDIVDEFDKDAAVDEFEEDFSEFEEDDF
jgi:hypothetical protein